MIFGHLFCKDPILLLLSCLSHNFLPLAGACLCPLCHGFTVEACTSRTLPDFNICNSTTTFTQIEDPIDIHEQIYGTLNLSMYRSYPQSDFSVTFFSKELSHKINCPVRDEIFRFFSRKNQFSYIFLIYFGLKSCFSYNLIICEHDAWHYLIKF